MTLFTGAVSTLRSELTSKGYTDATGINQVDGEYALLIENHDLSRLEVKVSGDGLTLTPGLTNQNLAVSQATGVFTCLHNTYVKSSGAQLLTNFTDDTFLGQLQTATGIAAGNWVDRSLYEITLGENNTFTFTFKDLFEPGYILLPLADLDYQLDQLPNIPTGEATILTVGTRNFARTRVEANRFLIPGTTNRYFIALILNVQTSGEFPNFVVSATAPTGNMVNYLGIGASDLTGTMRLGWAGLNTTTGQYSPANSAAYTLGLATRQVTQQLLTSVAASDAVINQFIANFATQFPTLSFVDPATYSEVVTGATADTRTVTYNYVLGYDEDATSAVSVYTVPNNLITALTEASSAGNPVVMTMGSTTYTASQFLDAVVQDSGVFYFGHPITVQGSSLQFTYNFSAKPADDSWLDANWITNINQVIPEPVVIPVVNVAFDTTYQMANIVGGVDQGFKKVRFRYETDNLGVVAIAASIIPSGGSLTVSTATNMVSVDSDYPLTLGGTVYPVGVLYRATAANAVLELEYKVPSSNVNQVVGVNGIDYVPVTTNGVWDGVAGTATLGNKQLFIPMFVGGNVTPTTTGNTEVSGVYHRYTDTFDDGDIIAFQAGGVDFCFNKGALPGTHLRGAVESSNDGDTVLANLGVESFILAATDISRGYWFNGTDVTSQLSLNTVADKYYTAKRLGTNLELTEWVLGADDEPNVFVANQVIPNVFTADVTYTVEFHAKAAINHVTEIYREDPVAGQLHPLDIGASTVRYMHVANAPVLAIADPVVIPEIPTGNKTGAVAMSSDGNTIYRQLISPTNEITMQTISRSTENAEWISSYTSSPLDQGIYPTQWQLCNNEQNLVVMSINKPEVWVRDVNGDFTSKMVIDPLVLTYDDAGTPTPRTFFHAEMSFDGNWLALVGETDDQSTTKGFILERSGNDWNYAGEVLRSAPNMNVRAIYFSQTNAGIAVIEAQSGLTTSPTFALGYSLLDGVPQLPSDWTASGDFQDLPSSTVIPANYIDGSAMYAYGTTFYQRSWNVGGIIFDELNKTLTATAMWPNAMADTEETRRVFASAILFDGERSLITTIGHPTDIEGQGAKLMLYHTNGDGTYSLVNDLAASSIPVPQLEYSSVMLAAGSNKFVYITDEASGAKCRYGSVIGTTVNWDGVLP